tara:strand:- start:619 stop:1068 length:450 start_codon:yes stop_codon:yes gene_type:complete
MFKYILYLTIFNLLIILNSHANELKINSDKLEVDRNNRISIFSGNVHAYNDDIRIWSENLTIKFNDNENQIREIYAENNVKIINQGVTATGKTGTYYPEQDILNIYGNVELLENNNYVKCDELYLDIKNSTSIMKSNSSNRVEAYITNN